MKKLFYLGLFLLVLFEIANVYFIMPMPGSQRMNSLDAAYFLYSWRWMFRLVTMVMIILGTKITFTSSKWIPIVASLVVLGIIFLINFKMAAEHMFYQPSHLQLKDTTTNEINSDRLVLGVTYNGEAKAYPIQLIGYHHQVRDVVGGKPIMITYCTVCRTGRVFEPIVNGQLEEFRLVGMDHFNAMFEDKSTKSWWRQVSGEAIVGSLSGQQLPEFPSIQTTLEKWIALYPHTLVMQPDENFSKKYEQMDAYERGELTGTLTRRDTSSWQAKSWVIGVTTKTGDKAYDWNELQKERIIHDHLNELPILIVLSDDSHSFMVLERQNKDQQFTLLNDTLINQGKRYSFIGISLDPEVTDLKKVPAYQEYWHSWTQFHPNTLK